MNTREESKPGNRREHPRRDRESVSLSASIPVGRIAGTDLAISYAVFIAAAGVLGAVALLSGKPGNGDLAGAAAAGLGVWLAGLLVQLAVAIGFAACVGLRIHTCVIGLVGIEFPSHRWGPERTAMLVATCLQTLIAMGVVLWMIGVAITPPAIDAPAIDASTTPLNWSIPSLGLSDTDQLWQAAGCLIWLQVFCQCFPMPRTLGRLGLLSMVALFDRSIDLDRKVLFTRRLLRTIATLIVMGSIVCLSWGWESRLPTWVLLAFVGVLMWKSAGHRDLIDWFDAFAMAAMPIGSGDVGPSLAADFRRRRAEQNRRRHIQKVRQAEHSEAVDAGKLDEILERLHRDGEASLSPADRQTLRRVSEAMRRDKR